MRPDCGKKKKRVKEKESVPIMRAVAQKSKVVKGFKSPQKLDPTTEKITRAGRQARRRLTLPLSGYVSVPPLGRSVAQTKELIPDRVFADFDATGALIGVEVL